jgi:hypothetical protein
MRASTPEGIWSLEDSAGDLDWIMKYSHRILVQRPSAAATAGASLVLTSCRDAFIQRPTANASPGPQISYYLIEIALKICFLYEFLFVYPEVDFKMRKLPETENGCLSEQPMQSRTDPQMECENHFEMPVTCCEHFYEVGIS